MPELPDLVYLEKHLKPLRGRSILSASIKEPIVIRNLTGIDFATALIDQTFTDITRHGPFLCFDLKKSKELKGAGESLKLIIHPMLAGRFSLTDKKTAMCFRLELDSGTFSYLDQKKMGKVYLLRPGQEKDVTRFLEQGINIRSPDFTEAVFTKLLRASKRQVRAFLMEQEKLSAIGNAYADEILFDAMLHPKRFCYEIKDEDIPRLYQSIQKVIQWGIDEVEKAAPNLEDKARDHMKVRNKKDKPCPRCGSKIRRANVLGWDAFFCPTCQVESRAGLIDFRKTGK